MYDNVGVKLFQQFSDGLGPQVLGIWDLLDFASSPQKCFPLFCEVNHMNA
jgi:hypothetical protein